MEYTNKRCVTDCYAPISSVSTYKCFDIRAGITSSIYQYIQSFIRSMYRSICRAVRIVSSDIVVSKADPAHKHRERIQTMQRLFSNLGIWLCLMEIERRKATSLVSINGWASFLTERQNDGAEKRQRQQYLSSL